MVLHAARRARNLLHYLANRGNHFLADHSNYHESHQLSFPAALVKMSVDRAWKGLMHKVDSRRQLPDDPARGNISPIRSLASVNSEHDFRDEVRTPTAGKDTRRGRVARGRRRLLRSIASMVYVAFI